MPSGAASLAASAQRWAAAGRPATALIPAPSTATAGYRSISWLASNQPNHCLSRAIRPAA